MNNPKYLGVIDINPEAPAKDVVYTFGYLCFAPGGRALDPSPVYPVIDRAPDGGEIALGTFSLRHFGVYAGTPSEREGSYERRIMEIVKDLHLPHTYEGTDDRLYYDPKEAGR